MTTRLLSVPTLVLHTEHHGLLSPGLSEITPPVTPTIDGEISSGSPVVDAFDVAKHAIHEEDNGPTTSATTDLREPLEFPDELDVNLDSSGRPVELGRGAWSIVYMASSSSTSTPSQPPQKPTIDTPPGSPAKSSKLLAVKSPLRRDAGPVLHAEALILTRLRRTPGHEDYIVPFHGYIARSHSIVMSAVPLSLSTYIEDTATLARKQFSTQTMFSPVQGLDSWLDMARKLISGLSWLHSEPRIVHGDIKPHNFLLRPRRAAADANTTAGSDLFPYDPLFADFSSAHDIAASSIAKGSGTSLSAMTPPFTAPELLSVAALKSPDFAPSPESDVFSLAVTLLAAATGDLLLYPGSNPMQRLAMAREGHRVVDFTRSGQNGSRVPRNGAVEQVVRPAICKEPAQRIVPQKWLGVVTSLFDSQ